jgi:hypothetical protein
MTMKRAFTSLLMFIVTFVFLFCVGVKLMFTAILSGVAALCCLVCPQLLTESDPGAGVHL